MQDVSGPLGEDNYSVTATSSVAGAAPVARTTFLICKYTPLRPSPLEPLWDDDVLHWGQKIHLIANAMAYGEPLDASGGSRPLFLGSQPASATCTAKYSPHQAVMFTSAASYAAAAWIVQPVEPAECLAREGEAVRSGSPLLLVHCATQSPLCLECSVTFPTDFGAEHQVLAHLTTQFGVKHVEHGGTALSKRPLSANVWTIVNGAAVGELPAGEGPLYDLGALLKRVAGDLLATGLLAALDQKLCVLCDQHGDLDAGELLLVLRQCGVRASEEDVCALVAEFAGAAPGRVAGRVFVATLQQRAASMRGN